MYPVTMLISEIYLVGTPSMTSPLFEGASFCLRLLSGAVARSFPAQCLCI